MSPRETLLAVIATAIADGVPEIERRVDVMRDQPLWGDEELPMVLLSLEDERIELHCQSPMTHKHTLPLNVVVYVKGESGESRLQLLRIVGAIEDLMREWQFILASDADPERKDDDEMIVESLVKGDAINYFTPTDGDMPHRAARLVFDAEFYVSGASDGNPREGVPPRNRIAEFRKMLAEWRPKRMPEGAWARDEYDIPQGENDEP